MAFSSFNFNPQSTTVRSGSYTVPSNKYGILTSYSDDVSVDGVNVKHQGVVTSRPSTDQVSGGANYFVVDMLRFNNTLADANYRVDPFKIVFGISSDIARFRIIILEGGAIVDTIVDTTPQGPGSVIYTTTSEINITVKKGQSVVERVDFSVNKNGFVNFTREAATTNIQQPSTGLFTYDNTFKLMLPVNAGIVLSGTQYVLTEYPIGE